MKTSSILALSLLATSGLCTAAQANEQQPVVVTDTQAVNPRTTHCKALNYIPANVEAWAALNVGNTINVCSVLNPEAGISPMISMVDSVAIGVTDETPELLNQFGDLVAEIVQFACGNAIGEWAACADSSVQPALYDYSSRFSSKAQEDATERSLFKLLINAPLPGMHAAVTTTPGNENMLSLVQQQMFLNLGNKLAQWSEPYERNGWIGVRLFMADPQKVFGHSPAPTAAEAELLSKRSYYIVSRIEGNTLIIATADSEEKLVSVSTGAPSVLNTEKATGLDAAAQGKMIASFYLGQDTINAYSGITVKMLQAAATSFNGALAAVAETDSAKEASIQQAIVGMNNIVAEISKLYATQTHPLTITAWHDDNLHLELACDASGIEFTKAKVDTTCPKGAIVHAYGSTVHFNNLPDFCSLVTSAGQVTDGIAETLPLHQGMAVKGWARMVKMAPSIAVVLAEPVLKMYNGLGNGWNLNVKLGHKDSGSIIPVISGSITLNDRKMFEEGWYDTRCIIVGMASMDSERKAKKLAEALTFDAMDFGSATVYSNKALTNADCQFAYALTDSKLGITTQSSQIGATLGNPTEEVAGITVNVDLRPILPAMRKEYNLKAANNNPADEYTQYIMELKRSSINEAAQFIDNIVSGGKINVTTEGGKLRTVVDIYTPAL